ncbi:hypothetical protein AOLI_G00158130 [Acnodon oligacanthus]
MGSACIAVGRVISDSNAPCITKRPVSTIALGALLSANCRPQSLHFTLPVYLNSPGLEPVSTSAFIDSGAEENLMDEDFARNWVRLPPSEVRLPCVRHRGGRAAHRSDLTAHEPYPPHSLRQSPRGTILRGSHSLPELSPVTEEPDLTGVPPPYHSYRQGFSKDRTLSLPPH